MNLILRIQAAIPGLCRSEVRVAELCIKNPHEFSRMSIVDISHRAHTSSTTVVRFYRHIGYAGLLDLKSSLLRDQSKNFLNFNSTINLQDSVEQVFYKCIDGAMAQMLSYKTKIHTRQIELVANSLVTASNTNSLVQIYGGGRSASVVFDAQHKLTLLGLRSQGYSDQHLQLVASCLLNQNDVAIFISRNGESLHLINLATTLKERKISTIAICPEGSTLGQICSVQLYINLNSIGFTNHFEAQLLQFLAIDILATVTGLKLRNRETIQKQTMQYQSLSRRRL